MGEVRVHGDALIAARIACRSRVSAVIASAFLMEHRRNGLTFATVAARLGVGVQAIPSMLDLSPGRNTLDVISDVLFAIGGYELDFRIFEVSAAPPPGGDGAGPGTGEGEG